MTVDSHGPARDGRQVDEGAVVDHDKPGNQTATYRHDRVKDALPSAVIEGRWSPSHHQGGGDMTTMGVGPPLPPDAGDRGGVTFTCLP